MKLTDHLAEYDLYLNGLGFRPKTIKSKIRGLFLFQESFLESEKNDLREAGEKDFILFVDFLKRKEISTSTINQYLSSLRTFFFWLFKNDYILISVGYFVPSIKSISREKTIFTTNEITLFLDSIEKNLRDRVFFELLYSSGLRSSEALNLKWKEITMSMRKLRVEQGKGYKDRYVPFSHPASLFLKSWKRQTYNGDDSYLFPGLYSGHLTYACMKGRFHKYLKESGIEKEGLSIHSIRHSTATHLLEAGANVRYVSELLGHNSMETTVKYTHPSEESQRKAFRMYHPRENAYFLEIDRNYSKQLQSLRRKFIERQAHVDKYVKK